LYRPASTGAALSGAPGLPPFRGGVSTSSSSSGSGSSNNTDPAAAWRGRAPPPGLFGGGGGLLPAPGQGQGPAPAPAPVAARVLQDALSYLERVQRELAGRQDVYLAFLAVMRDFKAGK